MLIFGVMEEKNILITLPLDAAKDLKIKAIEANKTVKLFLQELVIEALALKKK